MKKIIFATLITTHAMFADPLMDSSINSSNQTFPPHSSFEQTPTIKETIGPKQGFFYVRFAGAENNFSYSDSIIPGLGIGYRRLAANGALDISINGLGSDNHKYSRFFWTAPKATYISYFRPEAKESLYIGGGLSWGGLVAKDQKFVGIIPGATLGYEFARKSSILGFVELNVSQPALLIYKKGSFPTPIAECTVGFGF